MIQQPPRTSSRKIGTHAVVMGGSVAGLLAARVLTDHFEMVTLVERDCFPDGSDNRKGVPQGHHAHAVLAKGLMTVMQFFPDLGAALADGGAAMIDPANDMLWYAADGYRVRYPSGLVAPFMSRPFLESLLRSRILARSNLTCIQGYAVNGLVANDERTHITGIRIQGSTEHADEMHLMADLIVDATGRGSRSPKWLEELGYARPEETVIKIDAGYTSRIYRRTPDDLPGAKAALIFPTPPHNKRLGLLVPIEGNRWLVSLGGWLGDHAPTNEQGYLEFARSLPTLDIYNVITRAEPLTSFAVHKLPSNLRRRFEQLAHVPGGFVVVGDALCSFNPIYGQGMTVAALEAQMLDTCLREQCETGHDWLSFPQRYFRQVAKVIDIPWWLAASADFNYPEVEGHKAPGTDLINWYVRKVQRASTYDPEVCRMLRAVTNLMQPLSSLFAPRMMLRVLSGGRIGRGTATAHIRKTTVSQGTSEGTSPAKNIHST